MKNTPGSLGYITDSTDYPIIWEIFHKNQNKDPMFINNQFVKQKVELNFGNH